ncbi:MAG: amino acid racemase [Rickettsiales bacterium]|nr:amino acid racemase [Rickettsiales bacterium]
MKLGLYLGMGQVAGGHFYQNLVDALKGVSDHERPVIISYDNPTFPRKDQGVLGTGEDPLPYLKKGMEFFKKHNIRYIAAPCNTVMFYKNAMEAESNAKIIDITKIISNKIQNDFSHVTKIGLLSTDGTIASGLYHKKIEPAAQIVIPSAEGQKQVNECIDSVKEAKFSKAKTHLIKAMDDLRNKGAEAIILGCTELGCAYTDCHYKGLPVIDSNKEYAKGVVKFIKLYSKYESLSKETKQTEGLMR